MEKLNVAIADDNEKMVEVLGQIIEEDKDLELVGKAHNGEEICNIIREKEPDVVVLDIIMPKMDGLAVMEKFANDKSLKKIPSFIVVSAVGQERITENAFNLGADYYILKPFDAQGYMKLGNSEKALKTLEKYTQLATSNIYPLNFHGDEYFDLLDGWLENTLTLGSDMPRNQMMMQKSVSESIINCKVFEPLKDNVQFQNMIKRLKTLEENQ